MTPENGLVLREHRALFRCPKCAGAIDIGTDGVTCSACGEAFELSDGIPLLFWPNDQHASKKDVTDAVRAFYEETPFPNYDDFDSVTSLIEKARRGLYARLLDEQIPLGARVLECGCGTGQLSNFLSIAGRTVFGTDICLNSLKLGQAFRAKNDLRSVQFVQMNLFRPVFPPGTFDVVVCNGVLHHTADPALGFQSIASLVKPGGYILVGLYHRYGRLITNTRRLIFRLFGDRWQFLDPNLREISTRAKRRAWFMDQYKHPHESRHTIGEAVRWLGGAGMSLVKTIPRTRPPFSNLSEAERLFVPEMPGNAVERWEAEFGMILTGSREGGFFTLIGRKE